MAPTLRFQIGSTVTPGDRIGSIREVSAGKGTYVRGGHVYASAVGTLTLQPSPNDDNDDKQKSMVSVELRQGRHYASSKVLTVGTLIVGRVSRVMMQQAIIDMVAAEGIGSLVVPSSAGQPQQQPEGVIRKEDVRSQKSTEETLSMENCFRPGDIVLCRILALGDTRKFLCTTGETELGVLQALSSVSGSPMNPISWNEMQCPLTLTKESRKCAKPSSAATASSTILMSANT